MINSAAGSEVPMRFPGEAGRAERADVPRGAVPAKWTVLAYISGDNDLESSMVNELLQMERVGSTDEVSIVAQIDRRTVEDGSGETRPGIDGDWETAKRYHIEKGVANPSQMVEMVSPEGESYFDLKYNTAVIVSPPAADLGEVNMAHPKTLREFLEWGIRNHPAEHYILIFADHGAGYMGAIVDEKSRALMSLPEMKLAISEAEKETGRKLDIIGFDACLMGTAEVAYEFKDLAKILVASQEVEAAPGWPIADILEKMSIENRGRTASPEEIARMIVSESAEAPDTTFTMAAIDLEKMDELKDAVERLAVDLIDPSVSAGMLQKSFSEAKRFGDPSAHPTGDLADMVDLCTHIAGIEATPGDLVRRDCNDLIGKVKASVISEQHNGHGMDEAHGLSIYAPDDSSLFDPFAHIDPLSGSCDQSGRFSYHQVDFSRDSNWEALIKGKFKDCSLKIV